MYIKVLEMLLYVDHHSYSFISSHLGNHQVVYRPRRVIERVVLSAVLAVNQL